MNANEWHLITSEYPPTPGGVSDYTELVASALVSAGDAVHVWSPSIEGDGVEDGARPAGLFVHRELGRLAPIDLRRAGELLDRYPAPRRLLVQWVPHGYGYRAMNLPFCWWLWRRASRKGDHVELVVHEPFLTFGEGSLKQSGVAAVHRLMTAILLRAARRIWMTIPAWESCLRPYAFGRRLEFTWLPVASNIAVVEDPSGIQAIKARLAPAGEAIVGHFGTYGKQGTALLLDALPELMKDSSHKILLMGRGGEAARDEVVRKHPELSPRLQATGQLRAAELSRHLSACDLLLQPYPDGISTRRTSAMVGLSHGLAVVTTSGRLTEPLWSESEAVMLAPVGDTAALLTATRQLLSDEPARRRLGAKARVLYSDLFDVKRTITALRRSCGVSLK